MATKVETLTDPFTSGFSPDWNSNYGTVSVVAGRARVACEHIGGAPQWSAVSSTAPSGGGTWTVVDSSLYAEIPTLPAGDSGMVYAAVALGSETSGTRLIIVYNAPSNTLSLQSQIGWSDPGEVAISYSATDHRWWRIRHSTGDDAVYWDTSPDGVTWTTRRTLTPAPAWIATDDASVSLDCARDNGDSDYAEFDNVNVQQHVITAAGTTPGPTAVAALTFASSTNVTGAAMAPVPTSLAATTVANPSDIAVAATLPSLSAAAGVAVDNPSLWPNSELVAVGWLRGASGLSTAMVSTKLPRDQAVWADNGFITVGNGLAGGGGVVGGGPDKHTQLRSPVVSVHGWAVNMNSGKPPLGKAAQLLELVWRACCDESTIRRQVTLPSGYYKVRVNEAYLLGDPKRIPGDEASYAHFQVDLQLHWVVLS